MLILPLHRPLTRQTFPAMTAVLLIVNVFVFAVLQSGDGLRRLEATAHYVDSGLAALETPAYRRFLADSGRSEELAEFDALPDDEMRFHVLAMANGTDVLFERALHDGELFAQSAEREAWRALRAANDAELDRIFTLRHMHRSSEFDPWRMVSCAFLHGGITHLVGNMLFLVLLGLLVEGALGPWRYLGLYLVGAFGSSAAALAWRWGEVGGGLGASGAIAALMGAFCVLWGRRPVRFFYWIFVVFDYVRAPAIWLLPVWLGWELWNLYANPDIGIGFDAHAGGLITGALAGAVLVSLGQVRHDFLRDDGPDAIDDRFEQAQQLLGRMQLAEADRLLETLQTEQPERFDIALARYRVATHTRNASMRAARARDLLRLPAPDAAGVAAQADAVPHAVPLSPDTRDALLRRWLVLDALDAAEHLLQSDATGAAPDGDAALWFDLNLRRRNTADEAGAERALRGLLLRFPASPQAGKARFLLSETA